MIKQNMKFLVKLKTKFYIVLVMKVSKNYVISVDVKITNLFNVR